MGSGPITGPLVSPTSAQTATTAAIGLPGRAVNSTAARASAYATLNQSCIVAYGRLPSRRESMKT